MSVSLRLKVRYVLALCLATAASIGLLLAEAISSHGFSGLYLYLLWNLFLAWIPFILSVWLVYMLHRKNWSSWGGLALSAGWLAFLPNSFYMISDFIHLPEVEPGQLLLSVVVFTSFIYTGVLLGLGSLYLIHTELNKRLSNRSSAFVVAILLLACSIAIYIGRDLRWNTWDVLANPAGMLFDLSERLLHPTQYPQALAVIVPFFVLLLSMYAVAWQTARLFAARPSDD